MMTWTMRGVLRRESPGDNDLDYESKNYYNYLDFNDYNDYFDQYNE